MNAKGLTNPVDYDTLYTLYLGSNEDDNAVNIDDLVQRESMLLDNIGDIDDFNDYEDIDDYVDYIDR